jgi:hypothetical protein
MMIPETIYLISVGKYVLANHTQVQSSDLKTIQPVQALLSFSRMYEIMKAPELSGSIYA